MSKMRIIPFDPSHVGRMELRDWDKRLLTSADGYAELSAAFFKKNGYGYTGIIGDRIAGAAGAVMIVPGTWEAWAYTTPLFESHKLTIHRMVKRFVVMHFNMPDVRRLQCLVDSTHVAAVRWARHLGFQVEGTLQSYGPNGEDHLMMAMVKRK